MVPKRTNLKNSRLSWNKGVQQSDSISQYFFWIKKLNSKQGDYNKGTSGCNMHNSWGFCKNSIHGDFIFQNKWEYCMDMWSPFSIRVKSRTKYFSKVQTFCLILELFMLLKFTSLKYIILFLRIEIKCHYSLFQLLTNIKSHLFS